MTLTLLAPIEVVQTRAVDEDDITHVVCHCTGDQIAACGLDCSETSWTDGTDDECPLCELAWPTGAATCPWGCDCDEDCGP